MSGESAAVRQFAPSELQHVRFQGTFRESLEHTRVKYAAGGDVGILALHAGIECGTGEMAEAIARQTGATLLSFWQPSADRRYHVTSSLFDPDECAELRDFLLRSRLVVSMHGHRRPTHARHLFIGGRARRDAVRLAGRLRPQLSSLVITADLREMPSNLRGLNPSNPVNRSVYGGIQLELPPCARGFAVPGSGGEEHPLPTSAVDFALTEAVTTLLCRFVETEIGD